MKRSPAPPAAPAAAPDPAGPARGLHELAPGRSAVVVGLEAPEAVAERLRELGFLPGTEVSLVRRAPLGDPSVYALRGIHLCLRRSEAAGVRVRTRVGARDAA